MTLLNKVAIAICVLALLAIAAVLIAGFMYFLGIYDDDEYDEQEERNNYL